MLIAFVHAGKSFLPGIQAYSNFFSNYGIETKSVLKTGLSEIQADVEWHFMGTHYKRKNPAAIVIHEYASASVPPFTNLKNLLKRKFNIQPDFRIYLNQFVMNKLQFSDTVSTGYRDLGLSKEFLNAPERQHHNEEVYDFIYCGSISRDLKIHKLLNHFTSELKEQTILILSKNYQHLIQEFKKADNIFFAGPVLQSEIPAYLGKARFAINFKPDVEPHNQQTATKLIEYTACKIPVITSDFSWVREFQQRYGGEYFYLNEDLSNFTWENINRVKYSFPDLSELTWEHQIRNSGVLDFLSTKFPALKWQS